MLGVDQLSKEADNEEVSALGIGYTIFLFIHSNRVSSRVLLHQAAPLILPPSSMHTLCRPLLLYISLSPFPYSEENIPLTGTFFSPLQTPHEILPKLFGPLRERYANRPGGYTRVLRVEPKKDDQAPSAILELVDGPKDMRFALTAKTIARQRAQGFETLNEITALNVKKVTQFRKNGIEELEREIKKFELREKEKQAGAAEGKKEKEAAEEK